MYIVFENILQKLSAYCAYRERSVQEVYRKALDLGCLPPSAAKAVEILSEQGFLNEERFVRSVVKGKFSNNKWGRRKIRMYLKKQKIDDTLIEEALRSEISEREYKAVLGKLLAQKMQALQKEENIHIRKRKAMAFAASKGFEAQLILSVLASAGSDL